MLSDWGELRKPDVFTGKNVGIAVALHLAFFVLCWLLSIPLPNKEIAIPIDLTVVVNENLDGDPDEPPPEAPPVKQPEPPPPPPPEPKVEPTPPPPPPDEVKQDAVIQEKEKKVEKKSEKPKLTKEEQKKQTDEKLKKMRDRAKDAKPEKQKPQSKQPTTADRLQNMLKNAKEVGLPPKNNGKTDKRPDNWQDLLNQNYRPGAKTQLAASENQRCISLIKSAFDRSWEQVGIPAWTDTLKEMHLELKFSSSGKILSFSLSQSSSDRRVDSTVLQAAKMMNAVYGLSPEFLEANGGNVMIRVKVRPK